MPRTEKTPGLAWRTRRNGAQAAYWCARKDLVKAGYKPSVVPLPGYLRDDPALLAARCHVLQAEMLQWSADRRSGPRPALFDGTFASLVRFYETHPQSPYHDLRQGTQRVYSKTMALLMKHKGARLVSAVDGADVKRWYDELEKAHSRGWAYYNINVLKAVLAFGASKRIGPCKVLREELSAVRFRAGKKRSEQLTHDMVSRFCEQAHLEGEHWIALTVRLQFDGSIRRRDAIGIYERSRGAAGIRAGDKVWSDGLGWSDMKDRVITRVVSKTRFSSEAVAVIAVDDYPELAAELDAVPAYKRIGPMVIYPPTGRPPTEDQCRATFRRIARKAGIPDNVWNMDARAGAVTEAYEGGCTEEEAMAMAQHTQADTSRKYLREVTEQTRRAAAKRVASRNR